MISNVLVQTNFLIGLNTLGIKLTHERDLRIWYGGQHRPGQRITLLNVDNIELVTFGNFCFEGANHKVTSKIPKMDPISFPYHNFQYLNICPLFFIKKTFSATRYLNLVYEYSIIYITKGYAFNYNAEKSLFPNEGH